MPLAVPPSAATLLTVVSYASTRVVHVVIVRVVVAAGFVAAAVVAVAIVRAVRGVGVVVPVAGVLGYTCGCNCSFSRGTRYTSST